MMIDTWQKKQWIMENNPMCVCGNTANSQGYCDGSHLNK